MKKLAEYITIENVAMIALFLFGTWCAISAVSSLQRNYELLTRVREGEVKNQILELEIANLRLRRTYYTTDEFLELQARSKLNKALPGEHLVLLPRVEKPAPTTSEVQASPSIDLSNPLKWAQFLLGIRYD